LVIKILLAIPPGQDLLCGDGRTGDLAGDIQRVKDAGGREWVRIPGSTLRGIVRAWCSRLAGCDSKRKLAYTHEERLKKRWKGDAVAEVTPDRCDVTALFGSAHAAGRIHITDSLVPTESCERSERAHVSVDHAWATSREGMLFWNGVLTKTPPFEAEIRIRDPRSHEAKWIGDTLRAIDLGVVRIGSSKASGRMSVTIVDAKGPRADEVRKALSVGSGGTR
jgi:hypothetical protein